jgi:hypothetical protein
MDLNNISFTGADMVVRGSDKPSVLRSLDSVYSEHQKLVFLFDRSISMKSRIGRGYPKAFYWTPELMMAIREQAAAASAEASRLKEEVGDLWTLMLGHLKLLMASDLCDSTGTPFSDDEKLQEAVVRHDDLVRHFGVQINWEKFREMAPSRMDVVKKLAKRELSKRLEKYPNGQLSVIAFNHSPEVIFDREAPSKLWDALNKIEVSGGTSILDALYEAMRLCRESPSSVGVHHLIVVTDGQDQVDALPKWVPTFKASGVVLDYIHIGDCASNAILEEVCRETNGEFVSVSTEADLDKKFVAAIERKCLPPSAA